MTTKLRHTPIPRRRVGDLLRVPLENGRAAFAWVLVDPLVAFFDFVGTDTPEVSTLVAQPILFRLWVMDDARRSGKWEIVGHAEVPSNEIANPPKFFIQDTFTGKLTTTFDGSDERTSGLAQCELLECAAVWETEHVVERIQDHYAGRPNRWVEVLRPRSPTKGRTT